MSISLILLCQPNICGWHVNQTKAKWLKLAAPLDAWLSYAMSVTCYFGINLQIGQFNLRQIGRTLIWTNQLWRMQCMYFKYNWTKFMWSWEDANKETIAFVIHCSRHCPWSYCIIIIVTCWVAMIFVVVLLLLPFHEVCPFSR